MPTAHYDDIIFLGVSEHLNQAKKQSILQQMETFHGIFFTIRPLLVLRAFQNFEDVFLLAFVLNH